MRQINKEEGHLVITDPNLQKTETISKETPVIFFDGVCGMCNKSVNFFISIDFKNRLRFSPLQGEYAKTQLTPATIQDLDSIVFCIDGKTYKRSEAVLRMFQQVGSLWTLLTLFLLVPPFIRDAVYNFIAKHRYEIFGKHDTCRMPTPEERARFID